MNITYSKIKKVEEIEILRNKSSFNYTYDQATIEALKKYFTLKDSWQRSHFGAYFLIFLQKEIQSST